MTPTAELREELRELLDEAIPEGGSESDTRFTDAQPDRLLSKSRNIYAAAAEGWTIKAGMLQRELGQIEQYGVGAENYKVVNLTTAISAALNMAKTFRNMAASTMGSVILKFKPPEVL